MSRERAMTLLAAAVAVAAAGPALAHHPMGGATPKTLMEGLLSGLGHPIIGIDHLAFIVGFGLLAGLSGVGVRVPLAFVAASLLGVLAEVAGRGLPGAELIVAGSVVVVGIVMALRARAPAMVSAAFALVAGLAHGTAFAEAVIGAETTPIVAYLAGLAAVQGLLAAAATVMGERVLALPDAGARIRPAGIVLALIGATYLVTHLVQA